MGIFLFGLIYLFFISDPVESMYDADSEQNACCIDQNIPSLHGAARDEVLMNFITDCVEKAVNIPGSVTPQSGGEETAVPEYWKPYLNLLRIKKCAIGVNIF